MATLTDAQALANYTALVNANGSDLTIQAKAAKFNQMIGSGLHAAMEAVADVTGPAPAEPTDASLLTSYNALLSGLATNPVIQARAAAFNQAWMQTGSLRSALKALQQAGG